MGANGFLGSHVARQLLAANQPTKSIHDTADTVPLMIWNCPTR